MKAIRIRSLIPSDAPMVALLIPQLTKNILPKDLVEWIKELSKPKDYQCYVAEKESKVVGFSQIVWYPIASKEIMARVEEFVVDEKFRRQGVGKAMIKVLLEKAQEVNAAQVKLETANPFAVRLYEWAGFVVKKEDLMMIKKYY